MQRLLDADTQSVHNLKVVARDAAGHPNSAEATVLISVIDSNDNEPSITFDGPAVNDTVSVTEGEITDKSNNNQFSINKLSRYTI